MLRLVSRVRFRLNPATVELATEVSDCGECPFPSLQHFRDMREGRMRGIQFFLRKFRVANDRREAVADLKDHLSRDVRVLFDREAAYRVAHRLPPIGSLTLRKHPQVCLEYLVG